MNVPLTPQTIKQMISGFRMSLVLLVLVCSLSLLLQNGSMKDINWVYIRHVVTNGYKRHTNDTSLVTTNGTHPGMIGALRYLRGNNTAEIFTENVDMELNQRDVKKTVIDLEQTEISQISMISSLDLDMEKYDKLPRIGIQMAETAFEMNYDWNIRRKGSLEIFILSVIGFITETASRYQIELKLQGWQAGKHKHSDIKCCILYKSNRVSEYFNPKRVSQHRTLGLLGTQISCPINSSLSRVKGVTLEFTKKKCSPYLSEYIKPLIPRLQTKNNSFAICLKILYGRIDSDRLINWIEYYREMQVDKIFMFTYNITDRTQEILQHYYQLGLVEWRHFDFPWKTGRFVGKKTPLAWEDEQVAVYDCFQRLHSYTYFSIIDLDEYLLPRKHENLKDMMKYLVRTNHTAGGFRMKSYLFNTNWDASGKVNGSTIEKYLKRTRAFQRKPARPKNILIPTRVIVDKYFHTHNFSTAEGFESVSVDETVAAVNHYRECYKDLRDACAINKAVTDTDILKVIPRFRKRTRWFSESTEVEI